MTTRRGAAVLAFGLVCGAATLDGGAARPDKPPLAHTGGFGEPTCARCHLGDAPDPADRALTVEGLPERYEPGRSYDFAVVLRRAELRVAGFEAAIRFDSGDQAGELVVHDTARVTVERDSVHGVVYAHHTRTGTMVERAVARWLVRWEAPLGGGNATIHVSAVVSNDDNSNLGDIVYNNSAPLRRR